jgi:hypothetical protein
MTPEQRAQVISDMLRTAYGLEVSEPIRKTLAIVIESAEDEALERAAAGVDLMVRVERNAGRADVLAVAADVVRGFKSPPERP